MCVWCVCIAGTCTNGQEQHRVCFDPWVRVIRGRSIISPPSLLPLLSMKPISLPPCSAPLPLSSRKRKSDASEATACRPSIPPFRLIFQASPPQQPFSSDSRRLFSNPIPVNFPPIARPCTNPPPSRPSSFLHPNPHALWMRRTRHSRERNPKDPKGQKNDSKRIQNHPQRKSKRERERGREGGRETYDLLNDLRRRVKVDESLVDLHLESVPGLGSLSARTIFHQQQKTCAHIHATDLG